MIYYSPVQKEKKSPRNDWDHVIKALKKNRLMLYRRRGRPSVRPQRWMIGKYISVMNRMTPAAQQPFI